MRLFGNVPFLYTVQVVALTYQGMLAAHQALITGKVTAGGSPLAGATITIPAMAGVGTVSDEAGNYRLAVSSRLETVVVLARAIGYKPVRTSVTMTNNVAPRSRERETR